MFATIRKNQKWLLWVIISVIIVTFVIFFTPEAGNMVGGRGNIDYGSIDGQPVTPGEFEMARREASLIYLTSTGTWPGEGGSNARSCDVANDSLQRLALIRSLEEMGSYADEAAAVGWIKRNFADADGAFNKGLYDQFIDGQIKARGISEEQFIEFVKHQVSFAQLQDVAGASGALFTESEAKLEFSEQFKTRSTEAVFLNTSNYAAQVKIDTNAVKLYFTNNIARYREPAKAVATYVTFANSNYLSQAEAKMAEIEDVDARLQAIYEDEGTNSFTGDDGKVLSREAALTKIRDEQLNALAHREARVAANELLTKIYNLQQTQTNLFETNLVSLASGMGLEAKTSEPFTATGGPDEIPFTARRTFAQAVFGLSAGSAISMEPIRSPEDAVYVVALNKRIPSKTPTFEEKTDTVIEDYKDSETMKLMREAGNKLYGSLTNHLAQGKTFIEAAKGEGFEAKSFPAFSRRDRTQEEISKFIPFTSFSSTAFQTEVGEVSRLGTSGETGYLIHVSSEGAPSEEKMKEELDEFIEMNRNGRRSAATSAFLSKLIESKRIVPPASAE